MIPNISSNEINQIFLDLQKLNKKQLLVVFFPSLILLYLFILTLNKFQIPVRQS